MHRLSRNYKLGLPSHLPEPPFPLSFSIFTIALFAISFFFFPISWPRFLILIFSFSFLSPLPSLALCSNN